VILEFVLVPSRASETVLDFDEGPDSARVPTEPKGGLLWWRMAEETPEDEGFPLKLNMTRRL